MFASKYPELGRIDEARRELELAGNPSGTLLRISRAMVLGPLHEPEEARALLRELVERPDRECVSLDYVIALYSLVGERERALELVESTVRAGDSGLWLRHWSVVFDSFRADPRFEAAVRAFHLPERVLRKVS